jgi:glycosyltransferase involved in cell wall biosynthesis
MRIAMHATTLRHWGALRPTAPFEDVPSPAGTELAMLAVSYGLAKLGHQVRVFANCEGQVVRGVEFLPAEMAMPLLTQSEHDVIVSWQDPAIFLYPLRAKLKVLLSESTQLGVGQVAQKIDRYMAVSRKSAELLLNSDPYADPDKVWITRNPVLLERFAGLDYHQRNPHRLVWGSSPDRGLHHFVDIFPRIRAQVPDAELVVTYEFDKTLASYRQTQSGSAYVRWLEKAQRLKEMEGVRVLNHISQPKMAELLASAGVFVYSCDPISATETYCSAITEAMAAGCVVVCSDADCLKENYEGAALVLPLPIDPEQWAQEIVSLMTTESERRSALLDQGFLLAHASGDTMVASEWEDFFTGFLEGKEVTPDHSLRAILEAVR